MKLKETWGGRASSHFALAPLLLTSKKTDRFDEPRSPVAAEPPHRPPTPYPRCSPSAPRAEPPTPCRTVAHAAHPPALPKKEREPVGDPTRVAQQLAHLGAATGPRIELRDAIATWLRRESDQVGWAGFHLFGPIWMTGLGLCLRLKQPGAQAAVWLPAAEARHDARLVGALASLPQSTVLLDADVLHKLLQCCAERFLQHALQTLVRLPRRRAEPKTMSSSRPPTPQHPRLWQRPSAPSERRLPQQALPFWLDAHS